MPKGRGEVPMSLSLRRMLDESQAIVPRVTGVNLVKCSKRRRIDENR